MRFSVVKAIDHKRGDFNNLNAYRFTIWLEAEASSSFSALVSSDLVASFSASQVEFRMELIPCPMVHKYLTSIFLIFSFCARIFFIFFKLFFS